MYIFLDTEFLPLPDGKATLLSVGLCRAHGEEFYAEHEVDVDPGANTFVAAHVLPQLGNGLGLRASLPEIGAALASWMEQFAGDHIEVCYDYHRDREALEELLHLAARDRSIRFEPVHVGYLLDDADGTRAAEQCWQRLELERGLKRHHALADAHALRARFSAVHPDPVIELPHTELEFNDQEGGTS